MYIHEEGRKRNFLKITTKFPPSRSRNLFKNRAHPLPTERRKESWKEGEDSREPRAPIYDQGEHQKYPRRIRNTRERGREERCTHAYAYVGRVCVGIRTRAHMRAPIRKRASGGVRVHVDGRAHSRKDREPTSGRAVLRPRDRGTKKTFPFLRGLGLDYIVASRSHARVSGTGGAW